MADPLHEHEVHVREVPLPGPSRLFQLTLASGELLSVRTEPTTTDRVMSITAPGADAASVTVHCSGPEATTLAALLSGFRFVVHEPDHQPVDAANLRTVTLHAGAPAVGRTLDELDVPNPDDARVIAVIRDDTADLLETDPDRPCCAGDRLVLVGRPGSMSRLVHHLLG